MKKQKYKQGNKHDTNKSIQTQAYDTRYFRRTVILLSGVKLSKESHREKLLHLCQERNNLLIILMFVIGTSSMFR